LVITWYILAIILAVEYIFLNKLFKKKIFRIGVVIMIQLSIITELSAIYFQWSILEKLHIERSFESSMVGLIAMFLFFNLLSHIKSY